MRPADAGKNQRVKPTNCPTRPGISGIHRPRVNSPASVVNPVGGIHGCPGGTIGLVCPSRVCDTGGDHGGVTVGLTVGWSWNG
ncbi:Hypothetical protein SCLAV_0933 [Streptomyces clavuligerus]|uniref:Uncharacterized protein n=1 Tax=Streptomyces clavuligerus TaxID=1901 RepID=E2PWH7_STRCL|nr:Hypothetical protein SCLAV_0933 [Streptomyces clavuligerus]